MKPQDSLTRSELLREKFLAEHPDARVATGLPRINVAAFAATLLKEQRQWRLDAKTRRELVSERNRRHRMRIRMPRLTPTSKPFDTRTDAARSVMYLELENGQAVNCARVLGTRGLKSRTDAAGWASYFGRTNACKRRAARHAANPVLRAICLAAVEANASREAA